MTFLKKYYPLFLILGLASILRVHMLFVRGTFWFDEVFSVRFSSLPWKEAIKYWIIETNPPFYTIFLRFWLALTNTDNEILIRLPSLLAGIASIALLYFFAEKFFNRRAAIAGAIFFALADVHIFMSTEARVYSILCLFSIISFFFYYTIFFQNKKTKLAWAGYFLTNFILLFSHLTALSVPFTQMFGLVLIKPEKKDLWKWWIGHVISGLFWLMWFVPSIIAKIDPASLTAWYFDDKSASGANLLTMLISLFSASSLQPMILSFMAVLFILALVHYFQNLKNTDSESRKRLIILSAWALTLPIVGAMLGVLSAIKFYISAVPALYLVIGYSISSFAKQTKTFFLAMVIAVLFILPSSLIMSNTEIFSWYNFTKYIERNETSKSIVLITPFNETLPFGRYYKGHSPVWGIYLREDGMSWDERMVRYNWNQQSTTKEKLVSWLEPKISGVDKIFYIQYTSDFFWVHQALTTAGWTINKEVNPRGLVDIQMFEFYAPTN